MRYINYFEGFYHSYLSVISIYVMSSLRFCLLPDTPRVGRGSVHRTNIGPDSVSRYLFLHSLSYLVGSILIAHTRFFSVFLARISSTLLAGLPMHTLSAKGDLEANLALAVLGRIL